MNCLNGAWRRLLPEFTHDFTLFGPVENSDDDFSRLAQEAGLDEVTAEDITELLNSHGQEFPMKTWKNWLKNSTIRRRRRKKKMKSLL